MSTVVCGTGGWADVLGRCHRDLCCVADRCRGGVVDLRWAVCSRRNRVGVADLRWAVCYRRNHAGVVDLHWVVCSRRNRGGVVDPHWVACCCRSRGGAGDLRWAVCWLRNHASADDLPSAVYCRSRDAAGGQRIRDGAASHWNHGDRGAWAGDPRQVVCCRRSRGVVAYRRRVWREGGPGS